MDSLDSKSSRAIRSADAAATQSAESALNPSIKISFAEKAEIETRQRQTIERELLEQKLEFSAGPYEALVQFSNYCNMSCIMCWNGNNPRTKNMSPELVERVGSQLGPHVSLIEPYSGSEPLAMMWDETRNVAREYGVHLLMTTNGQFLSEERFHELKEVTETLYFSIDSHIPEIFNKIRLRAKTDLVFENIVRAARLAKENNLECTVNIVLLTYNIPHIADSANYFSEIGVETINVIQMIDVNHQSHFYDALVHCSPEYIEWVKQQTIESCRENNMRLMWNVGQTEIFDFRKERVEAKPRKAENDHFDWRMKFKHPGFCRFAYGRLRVEVNGNVTPCCYATEGQLPMGNLGEQEFFEEIWNGTTAQDLRRAMYTGDLPELCQGCRMREIPEPVDELPFVEAVENDDSNQAFFSNGTGSEDEMMAVSPLHAERLNESPTFVVKTFHRSKKFLLAFSIAGDAENIKTVSIKARVGRDGIAKLKLPRKIWQSLATNVGFWWTAWQIADHKSGTVRTSKVQCFIKHQALDRLPGSKLGYEDEGHLPILNLHNLKSSDFRQ